MRISINKKLAYIYKGYMIIALTFSSCSKQDEINKIEPDNTGYRVSLNARLNNPGENMAKGKTRTIVVKDNVNGLKTTWETSDKLTVAYVSGGILKTAELSVASTNGNSAIFHGTVETGAEAQAFKTSRLYAVNNKDTDKIEVSVSDNKMKVNVDLSEQNGKVEKIADYDLLYAEGSVASGLEFRHQMCVIRIDFIDETSTSPGNILTDLSFIYIPTISTDKSVFADKAFFEFGNNTKTCKYTGITFFSPKSSDIAFSEGKASIYIVSPANDKLSGNLSIEAKCCNNNTFRRHLHIKDKAFPAQKVVAKTVKLKSDDRKPNIGDYLYNDGTWGPLEYHNDKYPVALIFSNYTSDNDRQKGYKHGYAVALRDAAWPTPWGPDNTDYPETDNLFEHINATAPLTMMNNLDGLTICKVLNEKYLKEYTYENYYNHGGSKAAIPLSMEYGGYWWQYAYENIPAVPTPPNTSGWYLPSVGQWFLMFANLSGLDPNKLQIAKDYFGNVYTLSWLFHSAEEKRKYLKKFTNYFSSAYNPILGQYYSDGRIPQTTFYLPGDGQINWYLWACNEAKNDGTACCVRITQTEIGFTYLDKRQGTHSSNGYAARSIIAF